jgi:hypothetical protein
MMRADPGQLSGVLMGTDAFISHASRDKNVADAMCARLEQRGIRCWIAPRDIRPGVSYGSAIIDAINDTRVMVVILSDGANVSRHVSKEVERAVSKGVVIIPFRIEDAKPTKDLEFFLSAEHWLDAMEPPIDHHFRRLGDVIEGFASRTKPAPAPESDAARANSVRRFEEVAPDEWRRRPASGLTKWFRKLLEER